MSNCPRCGKDNPAEVHTCTPLALRLAGALESGLPVTGSAAAELRRLHAENEDLNARIARSGVELQRAVLAEREACAKVCDKKATRDYPWSSENADRYHAQADWAELCAAAIRARSKPQGEQT